MAKLSLSTVSLLLILSNHRNRLLRSWPVKRETQYQDEETTFGCVYVTQIHLDGNRNTLCAICAFYARYRDAEERPAGNERLIKLDLAFK